MKFFAIPESDKDLWLKTNRDFKQLVKDIETWIHKIYWLENFIKYNTYSRLV